jgi:hypothetical protein
MPPTRNPALDRLCSFLFLLLLSVLLTGCAVLDTMISGKSPKSPSAIPPESPLAGDCPVTEPVWAKPPDDPAVQGSPEYGSYFVNEDRSIWASAWWTEKEAEPLRASEESSKVGWFRPAGAALEITGRRIDSQAPPLEADIPCCYPTRFQATGLIFLTEGCWEVTANAANRAISFVVAVAP